MKEQQSLAGSHLHLHLHLHTCCVPEPVTECTCNLSSDRHTVKVLAMYRRQTDMTESHLTSPRLAY